MVLNLLFRIYSKIKNAYIKNSLFSQIISKNLLLKFPLTLARINLKKETAKCKNLDDYINLALSYQYSPLDGIIIAPLWALQKKTEITKLIKMIIKSKPKVVLEIGTAWGGVLYLLSRFSHPDALIISVDLPSGQGDFGSLFSTFNSTFFKAFKLNHQKLHILKRNSHDFSTVEKIRKIIKNRKVDVLFIDGDHSYEGVKQDFKMYAPLVREGGIMAFHDIVDIPDDDDCDVFKFWNEIKHDYEYKEFVDDWNQGNCGIGVIRCTREKMKN